VRFRRGKLCASDDEAGRNERGTTREEHTVLFLPYLRLAKSYSVTGVDFVPLRTNDGKASSGLESSAGPLDKILRDTLIARANRFKTRCRVHSGQGMGHRGE
jgi:hypothetical protein